MAIHEAKLKTKTAPMTKIKVECDLPILRISPKQLNDHGKSSIKVESRIAIKQIKPFTRKPFPIKKRTIRDPEVE